MQNSIPSLNPWSHWSSPSGYRLQRTQSEQDSNQNVREEETIKDIKNSIKERMYAKIRVNNNYDEPRVEKT